MTTRAFCIPGVIFLTCALVLLIIVSISLPDFSAMDFVRVHFRGGIGSRFADGINQLRFGIWSFCVYTASNGAKTCAPTGHGYSVVIRSPTDNELVVVGSGWTRGLAIHPVAAGVTFLAWIASFSTHITVTLVASLLSFLAALLTLVAFFVDVALLAHVKDVMGELDGVDSDTDTGPAFWLTFVSFFLLCFAGCTVCFGRRRARMDGAHPVTTTSTPFWRRFNRSGY